MISKTSRQLIIFHIFLYSKVIEMADITNLIKTSNKTIMRDISELQNTGLLQIKFSKKEKGYVHFNDDHRCPFSNPTVFDNKLKNMHLEKLRRLATIMIELKNHSELPYYDNRSNNQITCSSWYKQRFPNMSIRTMQRDFVELNKIGYEITYDSWDRCYMLAFPEGIEEIKYRIEARL